MRLKRFDMNGIDVTRSMNNISKYIKLKTILQIILLVGIYFWLIYPVKHSHDSEKEK